MRKHNFLFLFVAIFAFVMMGGCRPTPSPTITPSTPTLISPVPSPTPLGKTILVTNADDSGPGTLRQALQDAQSGDTIIFDPSVFPPEAPETITVTSGLRQISQGNLTIDASDAGVILDGSQLSRDTWIPGLEIVSDGNTIRGMQVINFTGAGIVVAFHGQDNTIGGDRNIGVGPIGQGNLTSGNDYGIGLWDSASKNTVIGNLVGTDVSGTGNMGNQSSGMWIETGTKNMIGPNNVIAHNARCGIQVEGPSSVGNTLSQNIIHNNNESGICMIGGGNMSIAAPLILGFDLQAGSVEGLACPNCIVEAFSDNEDEGMTFEGQAVADANGSFIFNKGTPFSNSYITITATDSEGNTSTFSTPTIGAKRSISLQQENNLPLTLLSPKYSQELLDNHIGVHSEGYDRYSDIVEHVYSNGFKWIRIQSLTEFWDDANDYKTFTLETIPPSVDRVISEYAANGVNIVLDLWMGAGLRPFGTTFQSEEEISRFCDYVRFVVSHFKGRIHYYEIWNEPGVAAIAPSDYVNLVRQVVPVIREEDPDARIIIGAIEGSWEKGYPGYGDYWRISLKIGYLKEILLSGVASLVDGISWHPFYENIPSDPYYQDYPQIVQGIKELAVAQGFRGEYFADELLWGTQTLFVIPPNTGPQVSPWVAAKYYTRAIALHRGLGVNVTINTYFQGSTLSPIHNINNILAGAEPTDISMSISNEVASIQQYAFSLPNGDRLVALWTNGEAVEDDPGVNTTLTFPSTSAQKVIGIDVLHGFEQELITETENGDLIIRNLMVKDYPIILRITASTSTVTPRPIPAEPADVIFHNGTIITIEESQPLAEGIALRNGLIQAIGTNEDLLALQGSETIVVNLQDKTIMPGFVDPHTHILNDAEAHLGLNLDEAQDLALKNGITTLADMYVDEGLLEALRSLESAGDLRVRTSAYLVATNNCGESLGDWYTAYPPTDEFGEMLRIGGVKLFLDGGTCGPAAVSEVVKTNEGMGTLFLSDEELAEIVRRADSGGYQIAIHALGDRAVDQAIDALNAVIDSLGNPERHRIEHALFMVDGQFSRFSEPGVNPVIFGYWPTCSEDGTGYTENWKHNIRRWRELADANPGLLIAAKTDTPWMGPTSPLLELYSLTTLREVAEDGSICEPAEWLADRTLTIREALPMLTINAAYMLFREDEVGSLEPGKLADLIVLSGNPLDNPDGIKDLSVLVTMVSGKAEYCAEGWEALCP